MHLNLQKIFYFKRLLIIKIHCKKITNVLSDGGCVWCSCVFKTLYYFLLLLHTLHKHEYVCMSECMHVLNNAKSESVSQSIFFIRTKSNTQTGRIGG